MPDEGPGLQGRARRCHKERMIRVMANYAMVWSMKIMFTLPFKAIGLNQKGNQATENHHKGRSSALPGTL